MKVREGGGVIKVAVFLASGVNADGYREILSLRGSTNRIGRIVGPTECQTT